MISSIRQFISTLRVSRYLGSTIWLLIEKVLRLTVGVVVGIWIARYLGPEQFGIFSYAQSFAYMFLAISSLGLDGIVVREIVKDSSKAHLFLGTALALRLSGALIVFPLIYLFSSFTANDQQTEVLIFVFAVSIFFQSFNVVDFYFQSKVLSKYVAWSGIIGLILSSLVKIILLVSDATLISFAVATVFETIVIALALIGFYRFNNDLDKRWGCGQDLALSLLKDSWPLICSGIIVSVYMRVDQIIIKEHLGAEAVGFYAAALRLSEAWYFIPTVIAVSVFPAIVNAKKVDEKLYLVRLERFYTLMVWLAIAISTVTTLFGEKLIVFLYGDAYVEAGDVLILHVWAGVFVFLTIASGKQLTVENLAKKILYRNALGAVANIALNLAFIPIWGIKAAAVNMLISWMISGYIYDFFDRSMRPMFLLKTKALFPFLRFF